jgi:hypothetical protein
MNLKRISTALLLTAAAALVLGPLTASPPAYGDTPVPAAPSNLTATAVSPTSVQLTWTNNATNQSGVVISRDGVESVDLQGATVSSYTWSGLSPGTQYAFFVASKIYGTPGNPTGYGNTQSAWVGPAYATTFSGTLAILSPPTKSGPAGTLVQWKASGLQSGLGVSEYVVSSNGQSYRLGSYKASSSGDIYGQYVIPCTAKPQTSWTFELSAPNMLLEDSFTVTTGTVQAECTGLGAGLIPYPIQVRNPLTSAQFNADLSFLETTLQGIAAGLHLNTAQQLELKLLGRDLAVCLSDVSVYNVECGLYLVGAVRFILNVEPAG